MRPRQVMPRRLGCLPCQRARQRLSFNEAAASNAAEISWPACARAHTSAGFNEAAASNAAEIARLAAARRAETACFNEAAASNAAEIIPYSTLVRQTFGASMRPRQVMPRRSVDIIRP